MTSTFLDNLQASAILDLRSANYSIISPGTILELIQEIRVQHRAVQLAFMGATDTESAVNQARVELER